MYVDNQIILFWGGGKKKKDKLIKNRDTRPKIVFTNPTQKKKQPPPNPINISLLTSVWLCWLHYDCSTVKQILYQDYTLQTLQ